MICTYVSNLPMVRECQLCKTDTKREKTHKLEGDGETVLACQNCCPQHRTAKPLPDHTVKTITGRQGGLF